MDSLTRGRSATLAVFFVNGFAFASWVSRLPDIKSTLGLSPGQLGVALLALSVGALIGLPAAGPLTRRFGSSVVVSTGAAGIAVGLVGVAIGADVFGLLAVLMAGLFIAGVGNGMWDVGQNVHGARVEQGLGVEIMAWFHAAFSAGTVTGALVGAAAVWVRVPILWHLGAVAVIVLIAVWTSTSRFIDEAPVLDAATASSSTGATAWTEPRTLLIGLMVLAAAFTEGAANDWLAVAFIEGHDVRPSNGVLALTVFLMFMTIGRLAGPWVLARFGRVVVLRVLFASAVAGSLLVVFGSTWIAFVGAAIWGIGASLGFPVGMSAAADDPERAAQRIAVVSTIAYGAFLAGPPLVGFIGDQIGVLESLLVVGATAMIGFALSSVAGSAPASERRSRTGPQ